MLVDYNTMIKALISECDKDLSQKLHNLSYCKLRNPISSISDTLYRESRDITLEHLGFVLKELNDAFSHICSSKKREALFYKYYCFPDASNQELESVQKNKLKGYQERIAIFKSNLDDKGQTVCVNANDKCIELFVKHLCDLSKLTRDGLTIKNYHRTVFLTGDYGEGKTIFLNYLLSTKQKVFDQERVINVKVDYTDIATQGIDGLKNKIAEKAIRIIKTKYFDTKIFKADDLENHLTYNGFNSVTISHLMEYVKNASDQNFELSVFFVNNYRREIYKAFLMLKSYIIKELNYTFIFLIDGMDSFNRDILSDTKFEDRTKELAVFVKKELNDSCYLIVMRHESHRFVQRVFHEGNIDINKLRCFKLFPVNSKEISDSKFDILSEFLLQEVDSEVDEDLKKRRFIHLISGFRTFLYSYIHNSISSESSVGENGFILNMLFNNNNRSIIAALKIIARDILFRIETHQSVFDWESAIQRLSDIIELSSRSFNDFVKRYYYIAQRSLMLNKRFYCLEPFTLETNKLEKENDNTNWWPYRSNNFDERSLIPNLFHFNDPNRYIDDIVDYESQYNQAYLIKIRILQYFYYYSIKNESKSPKNVELRLNSMFGYNKKLILAECTLLYSMQCLKKDLKKYNLVRMNSNLEITPLGKFLIKNLIFSYSYLENVIDNMNVPEFFCAKYLRPPVSIAETLDFLKNSSDRYEKYKKLSIAIAGKLIRVVSFSRYIKHIENLEKDFFLKRSHQRECFSFDSNAKQHDLLISESIISSVRISVDKILSPATHFKEKYILPNLYDSIRSHTNI